MAVILGWLQIILFIGTAAAVVAAALVAVVIAVVGDTIDTIEPNLRFWFLGILALAPGAAALMALSIAFYPSLLEMTGLAAGHCQTHTGHSLHLCLLHYPPPSISPLLPLLSLGILAVAGRIWVREIRIAIGSHRWARQFLRLARFDDKSDIFVVQSDQMIAVTTGLFRRHIVVSDRLKEELTPQQFAAVIAHEQTHRRRFDGITILLFRLAAALHLPWVRQPLLQAIELASEQCCDEAAAASIDNRITVAEAILAVERSCRKESTPAAALGFCTPSVEKRVTALLDTEWQSPGWPVLTVISMIAALALSKNLHTLHHLMEHAFIWIS